MRLFLKRLICFFVGHKFPLYWVSDNFVEGIGSCIRCGAGYKKLDSRNGTQT